MTDLCPFTGKRKLTASDALSQAKNSRRKVIAKRCGKCGSWHANSAGVFQNREERRRASRRKDKQAMPHKEGDE